jgi:hypothetical protein
MKNGLIESYLYSICDSVSFSKNEIDFFTKLIDERVILKEVYANIDDEIEKIVSEFYKRIDSGDLEKNLEDLTLYTYINDLKIVIYPEPKNQHTIPDGYDPITNEIFLFISSWNDLTSKEMEISLEHELQHYFDLKDLPPDERKKHLFSKFDNEHDYYTDEIEFNAHKRAFIKGAEEVLYRQHASLPFEKDLKKIPKRRVYDFFNLMNQGILPLEAKWFSTLTDEQKQRLLDELLKKLTEDILYKNTKLNLVENVKILNHHSGGNF